MTSGALLVARASAAQATDPLTGDPVITAVGDLACGTDDPNYNGGAGTASFCAEQRVSNQMLTDTSVDAFLGLGDFQYSCGLTTDWAASYTPTWGRFNSIIDPVAGNHEYQTGRDPYGVICPSTNKTALNYFNYFGAAASPSTAGHYSFNLGSWHLIALNANCAMPASQGCSASSAQTQWLQQDLLFNTQPCTLAFWHQPYIQGNTAGLQTVYQPWWNLLYAAEADVVLNGHIHNYQRFGLLNPSGQADPLGIREVIVGTGGESLASLSTAIPSPEFRLKTFGYLRMVLHPTGYDGQFYDSTGVLKDSFSGTCHAPAPSGAKLTVTQNATAGTVTADSPVSITSTVTDLGPADATNATLSIPVPSTATGASAVPSQGSCTGGPTIVCSLGTIASGGSATVTTTWTPIAAGTLTSTVTANSDTTPAPAMDQLPVSVTAQTGVVYAPVTDTSITPSTIKPALGGTVQWNFLGPGTHSVSDASGLGLFDTGPITPVDYRTTTFTTSGITAVSDPSTGHTASVAVPISTPSTGTVGTPIQVTWATAPLPAGLVEDVQVLRPGTSTWAPLMPGTTAQSTQFTATSAGKYQFRARLRNPVGGANTKYSSPSSVMFS
jgi:hypothetical protein